MKNATEKMQNNEKQLDFIKPLLFLILFSSCIGIFLFILHQMDKTRKAEVYAVYAQETNAYIQKNHEQLVTLLAKLNSDDIPCPVSSISPAPCTPLYTLLSTLHSNIPPSTLKNWSSTAFLIRNNQTKTIRIIRLSGDIRDFMMQTGKEPLVNDILDGKVEEIPWDDYTYEFEDKEVIVPVKDNSGNVVGAIIRGVIQ